MIVEPDGKLDASVVVIGEAPGKDEYYEGKPFVGASGKMLFDDFLTRAGILRRNCLCTNVHWERPPANDFTRLENPDKYNQHNDALIRQAPRKCIIAVGERALQFTLAQQGITKWRGSVVKSRWGCPVVPIIHPTAILRNYAWRILCRHDAFVAASVIRGDTWEDIPREVISYATIKRKLDKRYPSGAGEIELFEALNTPLLKMESSPVLSFDIETFQSNITCVGIASSPSMSVVIPFTGQFSREYSLKLIRSLQKVLSGPSLKIGQNLDYDTQILRNQFNIPVNNVWMDTMVAHSVMHPEMSHSLDLLASLYTRHPYYKEMRKEATSGHYNETLWRYNGIDCCITYEVGIKLYQELLSTKTLDFFNTISMPVTKTLIRMENKGVLINSNLRESRKGTLEQEISTLMSDPILNNVNPNSSKQVLEYLRENLSAGESARLKNADIHALKKLRNRKKSLQPFIDSVLRVRQTKKIVGTYLNAKTHLDGRMRTSYRTSATDTGRISSSKDVYNKGMNLQNVPVNQRDWFIPDDNMVFWEADASQIEARITAWIAKDKNYITGFIDGRDIHTENALALFRIPEHKVHDPIEDTQYSYRDVGKRASHAINYKIGPRKLKELMNEYVPTLPFSESDAIRFIESFKDLRPGITKWWNDVFIQLKQPPERQLRNIFGRRRVFLSRMDDNLHRAAIAFLPQSAAADHINKSLVAIEQKLRATVPTASVLVQVHDSIGGQCYPNDLDLVKAIVTTEMELPLPIEFEGTPLIVPADFGSGSNWKECK